jgi:hypothetical protein
MPPLPPMPPFLPILKQPTKPTQAVMNDSPMPSVSAAKEPRPRPPRAMRPHRDSQPSPVAGDLGESSHLVYGPLRTKAERWEEIIAMTPVSVSARSRGMSVSQARWPSTQT